MLVIICTRKVEFPLTDMNIIFCNAPAIILQNTWMISQERMEESRGHDYKTNGIIFRSLEHNLVERQTKDRMRK